MHRLNEHQQIKKIEALGRIKQSALFLKPSLRSDDPEELEVARRGHKDLVDRFYAETMDYVPISQYRAAERDFEYFLTLIDRALAYFADGMEVKGEIQ